MSQPPFDARSTLRGLTGLDFGLRVRVVLRHPQRPIFSAPEDLPVHRSIRDLAKLVSGLRVYSYAVRGELEQLTLALQMNAECGSWRYARRAALDLADLLHHAKRRRLANPDRCAGAAELAFRIAEQCQAEARS
jgi:hypothetical protein